MILNKNLSYITIGVFLEKALPFIISFFFIKYIDDIEFGIWILYFQIVIIFSSTILSPIQLFFNREFEKQTNEIINLYNFKILLSILLASFFSFLIWDNSLILHAILGLITIVTLVLNNLVFNYLRFTGNNSFYLVFSSIRTLIFISFLIYSVLENNILRIEDLFYGYILSNFFIIFIYRKKINIELGYYRVKEFLRLSIYGLLTISIGGLDKLILLETNLNLKDLAILGYVLVFANSTNVIVEGFKKYFSPIYFDDFKKNNFYSTKTIFKTIQANFFLLILQMSFPFLLFYVIDYFSLVKDSLINDDFFRLMFLFSLAFFIYNVYHFSNPYIFYKNKSHVLSVLLILVGLIFIILVLYTDNLSLIYLAYIKIFTTLILALGTFFLSIFFKRDRNIK